MALSTLRLRRSVLVASAALRRASPAAPPASPCCRPGFSGAVYAPSELGRVPAPVWLVPSASFRSSPAAASSRFGDDEKISPDTILFEGCDYNHWLITMDFPKDPKPTAEEMVETYVQTCAKGLGCSIEEAKKKMYACSTTTYQGFQAVMTEEESEKFRGLPGVVFILPDSYIDPANKEYGGDKYINGTIIPRPPPIQYSRNQGRRDRPRRDFQPMHNGNVNDAQYAPPRQNYVPPGQYDSRGFGPPGQNDGRGFGPPGQNDGRRFAPPGQNDGRGFGPPGQNDGRGFGPPGQNDGRGFGPPGQNDGRGFGPPGQNDGRRFAPPGQNDGRNYAQPGQNDGRGYGPPGQYDGREYGPSGPMSPPGHQGDWRGPPPPQGPPVYNHGDRGNFNPQGPPAFSGDNRGMNSPPVGDYRQGELGYNQNYAAPGQGQRFDGDYRRDGPPGYEQNYGGPSEPPRYTPNDGMRSEQ